jgi:hypothetical protein
MPRPKHVFDNEDIKMFLTIKYPEIYDYNSFHTYIDKGVEDILYGACGQGGWNTRTSSYRVFTLLKMLTKVSVDDVGEIMNKKQEAITGKPYSLRTLQRWVGVLHCASDGIRHHLYNNPTILENNKRHIDREGEYKVIFTDEQKERIRLAAVGGDSELAQKLFKEFSSKV